MRFSYQYHSNQHPTPNTHVVFSSSYILIGLMITGTVLIRISGRLPFMPISLIIVSLFCGFDKTLTDASQEHRWGLCLTSYFGGCLDQFHRCVPPLRRELVNLTPNPISISTFAVLPTFFF